MKKITLSIEGMTCSACSNGLEKYLNKQEGVEEANVNLVLSNATIKYDEKKLNQNDLDRFVKEAGFKSVGIYKFELEEKVSNKEKIKVLVICIVSLITFYISMAHMWNLPEVPLFACEKNPLNYAILLLFLSSIVLVFGFHILKNGYKNLIHKTPNMDTLVSIGVLSSYLYSVYKTYLIANNIEAISNAMSLYYETVAVVIFFIEIGKYIENKNKNKTKDALKKLVTITPQNAVIIKDGDEKTVTLDEIKKGDIVICRPGEKIAVDGEITEGETHIDESFITGESIPVKRTIGMKVIAGSINYEGSIRYKAEKIGKESKVSEIVKMCVEATNTKAPIAKIADKISGVFVPIILVIAIISFLVWIIASKDFSVAINAFVSVLVVACPCSLGLATPLAIVVSTGVLLNKGILVKNAQCIENAGKIKNILFDKTGTLTNGKLKVSKIINYSEEKEEDVLKYVASLEKKSEHPIGKAVIEYAKEKQSMIVAVKGFESIAGEGIKGFIGKDLICVGNRKMINGLNIENNHINDEDEIANDGNSIMYVVKNNNILALIGVKDVLRNESKDLITKLKGKNVNSIMLTGDNEKTANIIAKELDIDNVISNCSPKEKAQKVKEYKENGITAMCGDGINDSISLINADIGIAIAEGTDVSIDSAEVILLKDNLIKILDLMDVSKKTIKVIKQNLFWAFLYNVCMIPVACGIFKHWGVEINPMIGSFAMMLSSLIVVLNSLKLKIICRGA